MYGGVVELMADYQDLRGENFSFPRLEYKPSETALRLVEVEADRARFKWQVHIASVKSREEGRRLACEVVESAINSIVFREELRFEPVVVAMDGLEHLGSISNSYVFECAPATAEMGGTLNMRFVRSPELIREEVWRCMEEETSWRDDFYGFFRAAMQSSGPVEEFMHLYHILLMICRDEQSKVDALILEISPCTEKSSSPKRKGKEETIFTRLRNEFTHRREDVDILDVKRRMAEIVPDLRGIVRQAISKQSSQP
jgi:hypothetical protein